MFYQFRNEYLLRVKDLQDALDNERDEKKHIQELLEKTLRLGSPKTETTIKDFPKIQGLVSPQRQRMSREAQSRKQYWATKAEEIKDLPNATSSGNTGS